MSSGHLVFFATTEAEKGGSVVCLLKPENNLQKALNMFRTPHGPAKRRRWPADAGDGGLRGIAALHGGGGVKTLNGTLHLTFPATSSIVGATSHDWLRLQVVWSAGGLTKPVFHQPSGRRDRPSRGAGATELQWHRGQGTQKKDNRKKPLDPGVTECRSLIDG